MPSPPPPARVLFLRPDTYGDLILFEPVLRLLRAAWPATEIGVLIRESYADVTPLFPTGVHWLTTRCNPYRTGARDCREDLGTLREAVRAFGPDWVVAACYEQTWLEPAVASFLPEARRIRLAGPTLDAISRAAVEVELEFAAGSVYPENVAVDPAALDWEKNLRLAEYLAGTALARAQPQAAVPATARDEAVAALAAAGLAGEAFMVCAPTGTVNVALKAWPGDAYAEVLVWLQRERGMRALLIGHSSERPALEAIRARAQAGGADPALWAGPDGSMPVLAGLLAAAAGYLGNDTGAMHLAGALGRPVAGVFGGGTWPRFRPQARRAAVVVQPLPCFGCGWHCLFGSAPCIREIPVAPVISALSWLLEAPGDAGEREFLAAGLSPGTLQLIAGAVATAGIPVKNAAVPRQEDLARLLRQLDASETDRAERLKIIEAQGAEISRLEGEAHRWLQEAGALRPRFNEATNERNLLAAMLADFRQSLDRTEADRAARLAVIESQGTEISRLHAEVDRWLRQAAEQQAAADSWRQAHAAQAFELADLRGHFDASEADRAARLAVIERQGAEAGQWQARATELAGELAALQGHFAASEADRAARLQVIEGQGAQNAQLHAQVHAWLTRCEQLEQLLTGLREEQARLAVALAQSERHAATLEAARDRLERSRTARWLRKLSLWPD